MVSAIGTAAFAEAPAPAAPGRVRVGNFDGVNWRFIAQAVLLIATTCACYWPALNGEFQWDDALLIRDNELLRSFTGLRDIWFSTRPYDYFPLTYTSFWLEWPCWGNDPLGYHLVNLGLHLTAAGLLWRLLLSLRVPGAWFGALLFALHPLNVASVAWIAERKNALSMVFYLACLLCYVQSEDLSSARARGRRFAWAFGFFVLAALSKSSVVMLPGVLLLLGWWRRGKVSRSDLARSAPFFLVSAACAAATMWFQYHRAMNPGFHESFGLSLPVRALMSAHAAWFYLSKALWPTGLSMVYPRWPLGAAAVRDWLPACGWLALLAVAWAGRARWGRGPAAVLVYFLLTLVPVAGLFQMSFFNYSYVSDHLVHLSLLGIVVGIAAALGAWQARGGMSSWLAGAVMAILAVSSADLALHRADQFSSCRRLWESARAEAPQCFAVYSNLGADAQAHGRVVEAETEYREAVRLEPRSYSSCDGLAEVLRLQGKWAQSAALYRSILRLEPKPECYNNLAVVLLEMGETGQARAQLQRALALAPDMESAYFNLFKIERAEHHPAAAADALRDCLRCNPFDAVAMTDLAAISLETPPEGATAAADPIRCQSAVTLAERACELTQNRDPRCLEVFSRALLASGRRADAIKQGQKSLAAAAALHQPALLAECANYVASLTGSQAQMH